MHRIEFKESNAEGNYATHGYFRYFGKLPPVAIRFILTKGMVDSDGYPIVDLMCGCGTSLVEAMILGQPSIGVDINPIAVLVSRVKTTLINEQDLWNALDHIGEKFVATHSRAVSEIIPKFRNVNYWFCQDVQLELAKLKYAINDLGNSRLHDFFMVAFLSIIRRVSNSSPRSGRLFHIQHEEPVAVKDLFVEKAARMIKKMRELRHLTKVAGAQVSCEDARATSLPTNGVAFVIIHPPYFALYKYSSDVLRLELEWLGANRQAIAKGEIEDGFKTTDIRTYQSYIKDVVEVLSEAHRILKPGHQVCLVVNNSTFRDQRLPVVHDISGQIKSQKIGLKLTECLERGVRFQQASYHRSAREDKITSKDYLLFFQKQV